MQSATKEIFAVYIKSASASYMHVCVMNLLPVCMVVILKDMVVNIACCCGCGR